ncbi:MAG: glucose-1-phosphate thymidylyltransferase [Candidatus Bathyarchaeia archaeon]|jgi:glucose-1-phosphate thymidylyltransferase
MAMVYAVKGIILHGGAGTRLRPLTHTGPKQLIPVANKPISQYVLEDLVKAQIQDVAIVLGDASPQKVKEHFRNGEKFGAKITYINQGEPKGIAHAVGLCREFTKDDSFVVYLGDNMLKGGIKDYVKKFKESNYDAMVLLCEVKNPQQFGVAMFDDEKRLVKLVEKPKEPPSNFALTGIYFFTPKIFDAIDKLKPSWRGELEITEALQHLIEAGFNVGYQFVKGWWKDTGTTEDILESNRLVLDDLIPEIRGTVEDEATVQGRVAIGENTIIKRGALIRGPTIIGKDTIIEGNTFIGPYTSIGDNVHVKQGEIENSIIMNYCIIDSTEKIIDSLIGHHTTIATDHNRPKGLRLIVGENAKIVL